MLEQGYLPRTLESEKRLNGITREKRARRREPLFQCQECGKKFYSVKAAKKASFGDDGCPGCGGSDIDIYV